MRVLHVVKTSDGARWAAQQAQVLVENGIEVHVALPQEGGEAIPYWQRAGATLHVVDLSLPITRPHKWKERVALVRALVRKIEPDIIHSHFVTTTMMLRLALGRNHPIPRLFQVPGPLHLEHWLYRRAELMTAGKGDWWIASSRYIHQRYHQAGIPLDRIYLSYYGIELQRLRDNFSLDVRSRFDISTSQKIIGNVNYMYPPKYYLGQTKGLKRHEDVIDAFGEVCQHRADVTGVLVGGQWDGGSDYEARLRKRARRITGECIQFAGRVAPEESAAWWEAFDCAVHIPASENCGGVIEPLVYDVPVIASQVGGLPEVVMDGLTGWLLPVGSPFKVAEAIDSVLEDPEEAKRRTNLGRKLVCHMFDVARTGQEITAIYQHVLGLRKQRPEEFDSRVFVTTLPGHHNTSVH